MKKPKNRSLRRGDLLHILWDDGEETILMFKRLRWPDNLFRQIFNKNMRFSQDVLNFSRFQFFSEVANSIEGNHDLIYLWEREKISKAVIRSDYCYPDWTEIKSYKKIMIEDLPLYLYLKVKRPLFEKLLKGEEI
jgi:hypothetical protein